MLSSLAFRADSDVTYIGIKSEVDPLKSMELQQCKPVRSESRQLFGNQKDCSSNSTVSAFLNYNGPVHRAPPVLYGLLGKSVSGSFNN